MCTLSSWVANFKSDGHFFEIGDVRKPTAEGAEQMRGGVEKMATNGTRIFADWVDGRGSNAELNPRASVESASICVL